MHLLLSMLQMVHRFGDDISCTTEMIVGRPNQQDPERSIQPTQPDSPAKQICEKVETKKKQGKSLLK